MAKRTDISSILIIGAGPIIIGQACEFDYSGAQACTALKEEGYRIILINSNPATIMTDPEMADATYIEPIHWQVVKNIIEKERPDALLPTMGGQTALNCALDLEREGVLAQYGVEMIGANRAAIDKAEDRQLFHQSMEKIGLNMPQSGFAHSISEALEIQAKMDFPVIIRPSFTMGGSGGGIAYNKQEFEEICENGLELSPTTELLIDQSLIGWKEFEMEVVRDRRDNCIIVCCIENLDPMGIHTGDSITVAPAQTLTDKEYQLMRNAAMAVLREIGVETGGSNVQFALNPKDGTMVVIEMNPRVSRSSALASKATGFPIARVAAKLAVGYTLDELCNEITGGVTPASFEPSIDYVVTKMPRFNFEKFPGCSDKLTIQMKSVGEVMALGRTFKASLQKAIRGLEIGRYGLESMLAIEQAACDPESMTSLVIEQLRAPGPDRLWYVADAFRLGFTIEKVNQYSHIDPWFLAQIKDLVDQEPAIVAAGFDGLDVQSLRNLKRQGFADCYLAHLLSVEEETLRQLRHNLGIRPVYKRVDTCAAEFASSTAYLYSCYETECEAAPDNSKKIMILGGGPNRIGQGIEFDYCCVHAALALAEDGYQTIMVNCNPETVSTDFNISHRLYFEPVTLEDVLEIVDLEQPYGLIVQFGGQTPLRLAKALQRAKVPILGTSPDAIDQAEDRQRFQKIIQQLGLLQPENGTVDNATDAMALAEKIGYPLIVRPSYVLGGRAMEIVANHSDLSRYMAQASHDAPGPVLIDRFLDDAIEIDIDGISDGENVVICGVMQHIQQAGVHSGDSSCSLPPFDLSPKIQDVLRTQLSQLAKALNVVGLINGQFALCGNQLYVLEINPRASRTIPFVSKVTGVPFARVAARCMALQSLAQQGIRAEIIPSYFCVKEAVFPFNKFMGSDPLLGPEMKSTGEVMGVGRSFGEAYAKAQYAGNSIDLSSGGKAFLSVKQADKHYIAGIAKGLIDFGFELVATRGTAATLNAAGFTCTVVNKVIEGRPNIVDMIIDDEIDYIVNTTAGRQAISDSFTIRRAAVQHKVSYTTTIAAACATLVALKHENRSVVITLQELHAKLN